MDHPMKDNGQPVDEIVEEFKKGARLKFLGEMLDDEDIAKTGWRQYCDALRKLDAKGRHVRDALLPLLDDPDPEIQVTAAIFMIRDHGERALPILKELSKEIWSDPGNTANNVLLKLEYGWFQDINT